MKQPGKTEEELAGQPHDALAYETFSHPELAAAELKTILPPEIAERIRWESHDGDGDPLRFLIEYSPGLVERERRWEVPAFDVAGDELYLDPDALPGCL